MYFGVHFHLFCTYSTASVIKPKVDTAKIAMHFIGIIEVICINTNNFIDGKIEKMSSSKEMTYAWVGCSTNVIFGRPFRTNKESTCWKLLLQHWLPKTRKNKNLAFLWTDQLSLAYCPVRGRLIWLWPVDFEIWPVDWSKQCVQTATNCILVVYWDPQLGPNWTLWNKIWLKNK